MQYIYTLSSPENPELVRYVGYSKNPNRRYNKHIHSHKYGSSKIKCWIKSLYNKGLKPIMEIIDERETVEEIKQLEITYIALYKSFGAYLKNDTIGGEGIVGYNHTFEAKKKISENNPKRKGTEPYKEKNITLIKSKQRSVFGPEQVNKLREMYKSGEPTKAISQYFSCSDSIIRHQIKDLNLPKRPIFITVYLTPEILTKYYIDENKTKKEIALLTGATERNIKKRLKDWKIYKSKEQVKEIYDKVRKPARVNEEDKLNIILSRQNGLRLKEISLLYNIAYCDVCNIIYKKEKI